MNKKFLLTTVCTLLAIPAASMADTLDLTGILRDFKRGNRAGGHTDFETCNTVSGHGSYGLVPGLVGPLLGDDGKPMYGTPRPANDSITSAASLAQWFTDVPSVNISVPLTISLSNNSDVPGGTYSYSNDSFFPIDNSYFGNEGNGHNFHFTFELHNKFNYRPGQLFKFVGDDDVWVYVNGKKVVDIGGVHGRATDQVLLFDGKAFVSNNIAVGDLVQKLTSAQAADIAAKWTALGMTGTAPPVNTRYIDLNLNGGDADVRTIFSRASVDVKCGVNLASVTLKFTNGRIQRFENLAAKSGTFAGTGANSGTEIAGVWVKSSSNTSSGYGVYYGADDSGGTECNLDFFFAERHTTESHFRIDTSINLKPHPVFSTITPLFD